MLYKDQMIEIITEERDAAMAECAFLRTQLKRLKQELEGMCNRSIVISKELSVAASCIDV